jgi:nucleoside-diphosphate-sugar epimerase
MREILVTGGAGFIGSALIRAVTASEPETDFWVVDDLSTGRQQNLSGTSAELIRSNVTSIRDYFPDAPEFDEVWHLSSPASPDVFRDWESIIRANVGGLVAVAPLVMSGGRLLVASSSEVYGTTQSYMSEDNTGSVKTCSVRGVYDESKRMMEAMTHQMALDRPDMSISTLRIFNTYGPDMPLDGRVINTFADRAAQGLPLQVHGSGQQTRSFCYIDDTVRMINSVRGLDLPGNTVVNIGNREMATISEVADMIAQRTGGRVEYVEAREDDPQWRQPMTEKLESLIGPQKYVSLKEGINRCL